jgi:hypothetical protein
MMLTAGLSYRHLPFASVGLASLTLTLAILSAKLDRHPHTAAELSVAQ